jgi:solute carrier family 12 (sodium/potassium/chloride transporter), member 2
MASLLSKFRIDYSSLTMIHNVSDKPHPTTNSFFEEIIKPFRERPGAADGIIQNLSFDLLLIFFTADVITKAELVALRYKTERQMRLRELLMQHSKEASMVVM